jgi:hypothetical protein
LKKLRKGKQMDEQEKSELKEMMRELFGTELKEMMRELFGSREELMKKVKENEAALIKKAREREAELIKGTQEEKAALIKKTEEAIKEVQEEKAELTEEMKRRELERKKWAQDVLKRADDNKAEMTAYMSEAQKQNDAMRREMNNLKREVMGKGIIITDMLNIFGQNQIRKIGKWSVTESKDGFRAGRKIKGKQKTLFLGKQPNVIDMSEKIREEENRLDLEMSERSFSHPVKMGYDFDQYERIRAAGKPAKTKPKSADTCTFPVSRSKTDM